MKLGKHHKIRKPSIEIHIKDLRKQAKEKVIGYFKKGDECSSETLKSWSSFLEETIQNINKFE